jgi:anti-anti-sigma factor
MGIQNCSEGIILAELPAGLEIGEELGTLLEIVRDEGSRNVILDFSHVDIITSAILTKLLKLHKILTDSGHRLVLCNVAPAIKGIFAVTSLDGIFEIVTDKSVALESLQMVG